MTGSIYASRFSQLLTYPIDTIKHSLQARTDREAPRGGPAVPRGGQGGGSTWWSKEGGRGMVQEARLIYAESGRGGFFRGVLPNLYKIGPSVGIAYVCHSALLAMYENTSTY